MGWQIVKHAFRIVFGNIGDALKASILPMVIGLAITIALLSATGMLSVMLQPETFAQPGMRGPGAGAFLIMLPLLVMWAFIVGWVAVTWHRYILLEEYPAALPKISGLPIWPYIGKTILLGLIIALAAIPVVFLLGLVAAGFMNAANSFNTAILIGAIVGLIMGTILSWLWYRMAVILPATAVEKPMTIGDGWRATAPVSGTILKAVLILVALNIGASVISEFVLQNVLILQAAFDLVVSWVTMMVGVSILTTLYGHIVEGRPLPN